MTAHLTEEEQIEAFKRWWKENGTNTLAIIVIAAAGYFAWQGWQANQKAKREGASAMFQQLTDVAVVQPGQDLSEQQLVQVATLGEQIKEQFDSSFYAVSAAMMLAKFAVEQNNLPEAQTQLQWAKDHNKDQTLDPVIDLRLARLALAQGKPDDAMALVKSAPSAEFTSSYAEVKGDILAAKGDTDAAFTAYQEALTTLPEDQGNRRRFLEMKRDQYASQQALVEAE